MNWRYCVVLAIALTFSNACRAADDWDRWDTALLATASITTYIDWRQTQYIAQHPREFSETKNILGDHPTVGMVNAYFLRQSALSLAIAHLLPSDARKVFLGAVTAIELDTTTNNRRIGVKFQF